MPSLFAYTDYRAYLKDAYAQKKAAHPGFSLRVLAQRCGFKARDYLLRVMNGERNLSPEGAGKVCAYFGFTPKQAEYFLCLVRFNQARTPAEKEEAYARLAEVGKHGRYQQLRRDQFEFLSEWYHSAFRSLLPVGDFGEDYERMGKALDPPVAARQARASVELLLRLGLLERGAGGRYTVPETALSTGDEVASVSAARFHKTAMMLARRSLDSHPAADRDISGITMSISRSGFDRIKSEIQAFRKRIMAIAGSDTGEDMIYHLNLHLFPMSRVRSGK